MEAEGAGDGEPCRAGFRVGKGATLDGERGKSVGMERGRGRHRAHLVGVHGAVPGPRKSREGLGVPSHIGRQL